MSCQPHEDRLYDYIAQRLSDDERKDLEAHVKSCDACRENLDLIKQTVPLLDSWESPKVSAHLTDRIAKKARELRTPWWQKLIDMLTLPPRFMLPVQGLAAAMLILTVYIGVTVLGKDDGKLDQVERSGVITGIQFSEAKHPIHIKVENIEVAMTRLGDIVQEKKGKLVRKRNIVRMIILKVEKEQEERFFKAIGALGKMKKPDEGYKDSDGNIVIVLQE